MAYTLIGGTAGGTVLILVFLPALYAIWFRVRALRQWRASISRMNFEHCPVADQSVDDVE